MHLQNFQTTLQQAAQSFIKPFRQRSSRRRVDEASRTLLDKAYVRHLEVPPDNTVIGYETPLHGDLIPVDGGFDYYPGPEFWEAGSDLVKLHLSNADHRVSWHLLLVPEDSSGRRHAPD